MSNGSSSPSSQVSSSSSSKTILAARPSPSRASQQHPLASADNASTSSSSSRPASCAKRFLSCVTLEPVLFAQNLCSQMVWVISQDMMMDKACRVNYNYSDTICKNLNNEQYEHQEDQIHNLVNDFMMWRSLLETSILLVFVLYLGSWSDRWGRKTPMIICLVGLMGESILMLVNSLETSWSMEYILLCSLPFSVGGGTMAALMIGFSYLADKTAAERRTLRVALMDAAHYLGTPVGLAVVGPLYEAGGFTAVFATSIVLYVISIIYVILTVKEQQRTQRRERDCYSIFSVDHLISSLKTTFSPRPANGRLHIIVLILAMIFNSFAVRGEMNVKYLFAKKALEWNKLQYGNWGSFTSLISLAGAFLLLPLLTLRFKVREGFIGLSGAISTLTADVIYANVIRKGMDWMMYFGAVVGICHTLVPVAIRSLLSKIAGPEDVGKIYAVMATGESVIPFASSPAYRSVYQATKSNLPGAFYYLSGLMNVLIMTAFTGVLISMTRNRNSTSVEQLHPDGANSTAPVGPNDVTSEQTTTTTSASTHKINGAGGVSEESQNCIKSVSEQE